MSDLLVDIQDLCVTFSGERNVHAVNGVSLSLREGETLGVLGESGSGKSVTLKTLLRLLPEKKTKIEGSVHVRGVDVTRLEGRALADHRGGVVSMIFQDPMLSLDPVYTIGDQIAESVMRHENTSRSEALARALDSLKRVRIPSPERRMSVYPHEMSGGMRQRAMIALAIACRPKLLLADEPTGNLDPANAAQVFDVLMQIVRETGLSALIATHNMDLAARMDRVVRLQDGQIV